MSNYQIKRDIHSMFRWAISKMFEQNPNESITLGELEAELSKAWNEMVDEGSIVINENQRERAMA